MKLMFNATSIVSPKGLIIFHSSLALFLLHIQRDNQFGFIDIFLSAL